jgi:hypothetical protein
VKKPGFSEKARLLVSSRCASEGGSDPHLPVDLLRLCSSELMGLVAHQDYRVC